jgi:hypothetical protein
MFMLILEIVLPVTCIIVGHQLQFFEMDCPASSAKIICLSTNLRSSSGLLDVLQTCKRSTRVITHSYDVDLDLCVSCSDLMPNKFNYKMPKIKGQRNWKKRKKWR